MKASYSVALLLVAAGCSTTSHVSLRSSEAAILAQTLANQKATVLYQAKPFTEDAPAQMVDGKWVWHKIQPTGPKTFEATVEIGADGTAPEGRSSLRRKCHNRERGALTEPMAVQLIVY